MPILFPILTVPWVGHAVCDYGISWTYSIIFDTIIIVDDNTIVFHPITKVISFRGFYNLLYFSVRKLYWHVLFLFLY